MKKTPITGILTCDPSWRGLAFIIYVKSLNYCNSYLYDLKDYSTNKNFKQPKYTIPLLIEVLKNFRKQEKLWRLIDVVVLENQYKQNMKTLCLLLAAVLQSKLIGCKVEYMSALTCKRKYGIGLGDNHYQNKMRMLNYVTENKDELIAGRYVKDHNTADACILLNTWLTHKKRNIHASIEEYADMNKNSPVLICPKCEQSTGSLKQCGEKAKPENVGKWFVVCSDDNCKTFKFFGKTKPKYTANGYAGFLLADKQHNDRYGTPEIELEKPVSRKRKTRPDDWTDEEDEVKIVTTNKKTRRDTLIGDKSDIEIITNEQLERIVGIMVRALTINRTEVVKLRGDIKKLTETVEKLTNSKTSRSNQQEGDSSDDIPPSQKRVPPLNIDVNVDDIM